jgi:multiple RNA-binding domain-containing protein 1
MATQLGVDKSELLDPTAKGSLAVRMALGETHIVAENKEFLHSQGVVLNAFDTRVASRSKTVVLIKNTPHDVTEEEVRALFSKHGSVDRIVIPPSKTMVLVEMLEPQEARKAFRGLAYRMFRQVPLYLEWAPEGTFRPKKDGGAADGVGKAAAGLVGEKRAADGAADGDADDNDGHAVASVSAAAKDDLDDSDGEDGDGGETEESKTTLFVKNLNFTTTEAQLLAHFEKCVAVRSARVATTADSRHTNGRRNMGGWVPLVHSLDVRSFVQLAVGGGV